MADEKLRLVGGFGGISVSSENEWGELYLVSITADGYLHQEGGVPQEETNFKCVEGEDKVEVV